MFKVETNTCSLCDAQKTETYHFTLKTNDVVSICFHCMSSVISKAIHKFNRNHILDIIQNVIEENKKRREGK